MCLFVKKLLSFFKKKCVSGLKGPQKTVLTSILDLENKNNSKLKLF